jgi:hypothetical protein
MGYPISIRVLPTPGPSCRRCHNSRALFNDVALLFLAEPVDLGPEADVVCLPRPDQVFDGSRCFATGWGKDQFGMQQIPLVHFQMIIMPTFLIKQVKQGNISMF